MRKQELLRLYQQGERNFRRQNLSGQSFAGQNLSEADFSGSDIRGANFSNATLVGVNFSEARTGLQQNEALLLLLFLSLTTVVLATAAGYVGTLLNLELRAFTNSFQEVTAGWAIVLLLLAFAVLSVLEGVAVGFNVFAVAFVAAVLMAAIGPIFATLINPLAFAVSSAIALAITIVSSVAALTVLATIVALAAYRAFNLAAAGAIVLIYIGVFGYIVSITKIVTSVVPVVPAVIVLSGYLGWRAMQGDPKHRFMRQLARTLVVRWGTSFRDADLTRANFSNATLKNVNFDQANLYRVCWTDKPPEQTILSSTNLS